MPPSLVEAVLGELLLSVGAEGLAVMRLAGGSRPDEVLCILGTGGEPVLAAARGLLERALSGPVEGCGSDRRPVIAARLQLSDGAPGVIAVWRQAGARRWRDRGIGVVSAAAGVASALLARGALDHPATTPFDPLTALPRGQLFFTELHRHFERLDRDRSAGTLILVEIDQLEHAGEWHRRHERDALLMRTAARLRAIVRPHDLLGRVSGERFAMWLEGMDHLTAAERADELRARPILLSPRASSCDGAATMSIGIATRWPGSGETVEALLRRADAALCQVKNEGGGHWRVSPAEPLP